MATLTPSPKMQFLDANGNPLAGGKLYTYVNGSFTVPQTTYTDAGAGTPNTNPIILDSRGEASVWLGSALYSMKLTTSADVLVWTASDIGGVATLSALAASGGSNLIGFIQAGTGAVARILQDKVREVVSVKDFGAVGDSITNDSVAVIAAISARGQSESLVIPSDTYVGTALIPNINGVQLVGPGLIEYTDSVTGGKRVQNPVSKKPDRLTWGSEYLYQFIYKLHRGEPVKVHLSGDSTALRMGQAILPFFAKLPSTQTTYQTQPGKHTGQWNTTYLAADIAAAADIYIWHWGQNDIASLGRSLTNFRDDLRAGLATYRAAVPITSGGIVLMTPNAASQSTDRDEVLWEKMRLIIKNAAEEFQCAFFDTYGLFQDGYIGHSGWYEDTTANTNVHPSTAHSAAIAGELHKLIVPEGIYRTVVEGMNPTRADNGQAIRLTNADSGATGMAIADNAILDFGTHDFTITFKAALPKWKLDVFPNEELIMKHDGTNGFKLVVMKSGYVGNLQLTLNSTDYISTANATPIIDNSEAEIAVVVKRETATVAGSVTFYRNGILVYEGTTIAAAAPVSVDNTSPLYIMGSSAARTASSTKNVRLYNRALTASEVMTLYYGGVQTLDIGSTGFAPMNASSCANLNYTTFTGASATGFTATSDGSTFHRAGTADEITTLANKYVHVEFDIVLTSGTGPSVHIVKALGGAFLSSYSRTVLTSGHYSDDFLCTANDTGVVQFTNFSTTTNYTISNLSVTPFTGCVLDLNESGIKLDKWVDQSGNNLHASYPAAGLSFAKAINPLSRFQETPIAKTTVVTLTIAELLNGLVTGTHAAGATQAYTLPTATNAKAALPSFVQGNYFEWALINLSAAATDTITLTANTGHTIVGDAVVLNVTSAKFRTVMDSSSTFVTYRL